MFGRSYRDTEDTEGEKEHPKDLRTLPPIPQSPNNPIPQLTNLPRQQLDHKHQQYAYH